MRKYLRDNWFRWAPLAALAILGCMLLPICVSLAQVNSDPDEAFDEYTDLQEKIKGGEELLKKKEKEKRSALRDLNDIDKDILYFNQRIEKFEHRMHVKKVQLKNLDAQLGVAAEEMSTALTTFEVRLVEWYKSGSQHDVRFLLRAEDLSDLIYRLYYSQIILEDDRAIIDGIHTQKAELFKARDGIQKELKAIRALKDELSASRSDYKKLSDRKRQSLEGISRDVREIEAAIEEMEQESRDIASFLRGSEGSPFYPVAGKFDGTLSKPIDAPLGSGFGMRIHPILHRRKMHDGQDFPAPMGTQIRAAGGGHVVFSGWKSGYGRTVIINHGGGLATLYAHCSRLIVSSGEYVLEGQVIAKVGSTGLSTGPHLHFEVRKNGNPRDPLKYIR